MNNSKKWSLAFLIWTGFPIRVLEIPKIYKYLEPLTPGDWAQAEIWEQVQIDF